MKMNKTMVYGTEARELLKNGVDALADAVKVTLGPRGRNVIINGSSGPHVTKDGVTVAKAIKLDNVYENMGVQMVCEAASKTNDNVGDGPQPLTAKILTPTGWTTMGELKVGDIICGINGTTQTVEAIYPKGVKEVYEVIGANKQIAECCEDHLWKIITKDGKHKVIPLKEMLSTGLYKIAGKNRQFNYYTPQTIVDFKESEITLDPFLVGLLLGDGSLSGTGSIELSLAMNKKHVLDELKLPKNIMMNVSEIPKKNYIRVKFKRIENQGKTMFDYVSELGLLGTKSNTKYIPKNYLYNTIENRKKLLKGLTATDGHINNKGLLEYSTISKQLYLDVLELLSSLGKVCSHYKMERKPNSSYSNTAIYRISELMGYKHGVKIIDIIKTGKFVEMQCIKVSNPDCLYITNDYLVTHNTSTSTILTQAIIAEGIKNVTAGANPMDLKRGMDKAVNTITEYLKENSIKIDGDLNKISQVASISANNDNSIGELISGALEKVGTSGIITVEESNNLDTYIEVVEGMEFDRGYLSSHFITDADKLECVLDNPYILVTDKKIIRLEDLMDILDPISQQGRSLFIIAEEIESEALSGLVINKLRGSLKVAACKAPGFGDRRKDLLLDIANLVGATFVSHERGMLINKLDLLGSADKITCGKDSTTIVNGKGNKYEIDTRVNQIKNLISNAKTEVEKIHLQERLSKLAGGVAVLYVGAATEVEMKEKKDRVDDALAASRAAISEGIVPGGGMMYVRASKVLNNIDVENEDQLTGVKIIQKALEVPLKQIAENSGHEGSVVLNKVKESDIGFDAKIGEYKDLLSAGIIDPVKVSRIALENANSVAGMFLTTECIIK